MILITMTWFGHVFGLQVPRPKQCKKRDDGGDFKDVFSQSKSKCKDLNVSICLLVSLTCIRSGKFQGMI